MYLDSRVDIVSTHQSAIRSRTRSVSCLRCPDRGGSRSCARSRAGRSGSWTNQRRGDQVSTNHSSPGRAALLDGGEGVAAARGDGVGVAAATPTELVAQQLGRVSRAPAHTC